MTPEYEELRMAILDTLRRKKDFTGTEEALADYILGHADDVAEMSIAQLSSTAHVSNAAVVRFCQKVGVDGYRAFRIELARELERARTQLYDINPDRPFLAEASTKDVVSSIAALSKQAIDETYALLSMHDVRKAARLVSEARRVVLYGVGDTRISLTSFSNLLIKLGIICIEGDQLGDNLVVANFLGPSDLAIFASYSGLTIEDRKRELAAMRSQGCKVIFITADETITSRFANPECLLLLPNAESRKERIATFYSQECFRFVLNSLYAEIFSLKWEDNMREQRRYVSSTNW